MLAVFSVCFGTLPSINRQFLCKPDKFYVLDLEEQLVVNLKIMSVTF